MILCCSPDKEHCPISSILFLFVLLRCNDFCIDKEISVASIRSDDCYCTNVLPLDRLYIGVDGSSHCNLFCSGIYRPSGTCVRDQCYGGEQSDGRHTYTVYVSGSTLEETFHRMTVYYNDSNNNDKI